MAKKAWIITVDMGYGHQRAGYPLKDIANERIFTANSDKIILPKEKKRWERARMFYEGISKISSLPIIGEYLFKLYDFLQEIPPLYPFRDLSRPTYTTIYLEVLIKNGLGKSIIDHIKQENEDIPFVTTFFIPALAAEYYGLKNIYCIITDADINRVWVPRKPKGKIKYFVPTERTLKRLIEYGIAKKDIYLTGFPLPKENLGGRGLITLKKDLGNRLPNLDPQKIYISRYKEHIKRYLGKRRLKNESNHPLTITFSVGGAGVQKDVGIKILKSLKKKIKTKEVILNLVAGIRIEVKEYFCKHIKKLNLEGEKGINIISGLNKKEYFRKFNEVLRKTDILWTKPSEMSFYTALGLPIILTPPMGAHEHYNQKWLREIGSGFVQEDPQYTHEWLFDWIKKGILAEGAWEGFMETPKRGIYNIEKILFKKNKP